MIEIEDIPSPDNYFQEEDLDTSFKRGLDEVLSEIKTHLTKEELLCLSLYKNSKKKSNSIYRVFFDKYFGKKISSAAITQRKKRLFKVLEVVGDLYKFKQENAVDIDLRKILTKRQYQLLILYEQRKTIEEIEKILGIGNRGIRFRFNRAVKRLQEQAISNDKILGYIQHLNSVLKFSRKHQIKI